MKSLMLLCILRVSIVVTGTSLMETDCNLTVLIMILTRIVMKRELTYVARVLPHQLAFIVVTLQPLMFITLSRIKRQCMWDCMQMDEV